MENGTIKFWNDDRGFGFIVDESGREVFFAIPTLRRSSLLTIIAGTKVRFSRHQFKNREEAARIELADRPSPDAVGLMKTLKVAP